MREIGLLSDKPVFQGFAQHRPCPCDCYKPMRMSPWDNSRLLSHNTLFLSQSESSIQTCDHRKWSCIFRHFISFEHPVGLCLFAQILFYVKKYFFQVQNWWGLAGLLLWPCKSWLAVNSGNNYQQVFEQSLKSLKVQLGHSLSSQG